VMDSNAIASSPLALSRKSGAVWGEVTRWGLFLRRGVQTIFKVCCWATGVLSHAWEYCCRGLLGRMSQAQSNPFR